MATNTALVTNHFVVIMSRISSRPTTFVLGLPGIGQTKSHTRKKLGKEHPQQKVTVLDPLVARAGVLDQDSPPLPRSQALAKTMGPPQKEPESTPPRRGVLPKLVRATAGLIGLGHGKPLPHEQLTRYCGTPAPAAPATPAALAALAALAAPIAPADPVVSVAPAASTTPAVAAGLPLPEGSAAPSRLLDLDKPISHALRMGDARKKAGIALQEAEEKVAALSRNIDHTCAQVELTVRRHTSLSDQAAKLSAELSTRMQALQDSRQALAGAQAARRNVGAELLETRQALVRAQEDARTQEAPSLPSRPGSLAALMQEESARPTLRPGSLATLMQEEPARLIEDLEQRIAKLEPWLVSQDASIAQRHEDLARQQLELATTERDLSWIQQAARANEKAHWEHDSALVKQQALVPDMESGLAPFVDALRAAEQAEGDAQQALEASYRRLTQHLLETLPDFNVGPDTDSARSALRSWADAVDADAKRFGADALSPPAVLGLGMQAMGMSLKAKPEGVPQALAAIRSLTLHELVPAPGMDSPLDDSAQGVLRRLAVVPRGMQVVSHLLAPEAAASSKEQWDAAKIYLHADQLLSRTPASDTALRGWLEGARQAAQHALHADTVTVGLAEASVAQRAAFYALRNGYESNAPGSPYDRANQQLRQLADWVKDLAPSGLDGPGLFGGVQSPLHALKEGIQVARATGLPTADRLASGQLREAAEGLAERLFARRALLPPGQVPPAEELALQALSEHLQSLPDETDLCRHKLDRATIRAIETRQRDLSEFWSREVRAAPAAPDTVPTALASAWQVLRSGKHGVREALALIHQKLGEQGAPRSSEAVGDAAHWVEREAVQTARVDQALAAAGEVIARGDPAGVRSGPALLKLMGDIIKHLEWRDKVRLNEQEVRGVNLGPLSAAAAVVLRPSGLGLKLIAGAEQRDDSLMEVYMGRTGLYLQVGQQKTRQVQLGAGVSGGYGISLGDDELDSKVSLTAGGGVDVRVKQEWGVEQGVQLRVPRRTKGEEPELLAQFMDMFTHLLHLAEQERTGGTPCQDWMQETLAHHPTVSVGLIDQAPRKSRGVETNVTASIGAKIGSVKGKARRLVAAATAGVKSKRDRSEASTKVAGYMSTTLRESTAQHKVEASGRLTAGVLLKDFHERDRNGKQEFRGGLSAGFLDLAYSREVRIAGMTTFSTLMTFGDEIDPARTDRGFEFPSFKAFEAAVRTDWSAWVHYGTPKLPPEVEGEIRLAVAESQLEDFLAKAKAFASANKFASFIVDWTMKPEAAPQLDALRAKAQLWREEGNEEQALREEQAFDDLMGRPEIWEPSILILREKTKLQKDRGLDFFAKFQKNKIAESLRTVGQWVLYEPVPRAKPGEAVQHRPTWEVS